MFKFKKNFLTLITRCRDEKYLDTFIDHYFAEGVDAIHIIDDHSKIPLFNKFLPNKQVSIHKSIVASQLDDINHLYIKIRNTTKWIMYVDGDEFITTRKKSK